MGGDTTTTSSDQTSTSIRLCLSVELEELMARCNRLLVLPFPTVALLAANAASTHFSCAYCFHSSRSLRNHRHLRTTVYSLRQQHRATPYRRLERTKNYNAISAWGAQRNIGLRRRAATGGLHVANDKCDHVRSFLR